ncbi:HlyD family secretion protein [Nitrosophilus alvini]|uniref:HlyD family secretion protein n=1 Tax=Nitrosophilus alvini TaxID=2714855 RepID=UPI00190B6E9A|nr:HlyD family efflux transporter periplasmic adaptor subunit [Nitrosophilus alvini]
MKKAGSVLIIFLIFIFAYLAYDYISYRSKNAVSDAAFVKTDSLTFLSFKVGGKIADMKKKEGDRVKKGDLLACIDDKDFLVAKEKIESYIKELDENIEALKIKKEKIARSVSITSEIAKNEISVFKKKIEALRLSIEANEMKLSKLSKDEKRYENMLKEDLISKSSFENIKTKKESLLKLTESQKQNLKANIQSLLSVRKKYELSLVERKSIEELQKKIEALLQKREALEKELQDIENKIGYCKLYAPYKGIIAKKFTNIKTVVKKGAPVYAIVDPDDLHVEVLLSEKKLKGVKPGCSAVIEPDAIKERKFKGVVTKILPASASTFSLVPRDIASGEFTKLDQRFVVRIELEDKEGLRVGMGATVAIKREN